MYEEEERGDDDDELEDIMEEPIEEESEDSEITENTLNGQKNINKKYPKNAKIFSFDVVSLYTNIDHDKCLDTLSDFFKDKLDPDFGIDIFGFREILRLVLKNNYFIFETYFYYQIKGIAMGSIAGPSIANIFVFLSVLC